MPRLRLNFAKMHIDHELGARSRVRESLEAHLAIAVELEADAIYEYYSANWDDDEAVTQLAGGEIDNLRQEVFPRLFRGSYVVMLFAAFEDCVMQFVPVTERRAFYRRNGDLVDKCRRHFHVRHKYPLWTEETMRDLKLLMAVRHVFAHQAGRLDSGRRDALKPLMTTEKPLLTECGEYLVPTSEFLIWALSLVERSVNDLAEQIMPGAKAARFVADSGAPTA